MWNQRSKFKEFVYCECFGVIGYEAKIKGFTCPKCNGILTYFNKHLDNAIITEIFKIEIHKYQQLDNDEPLENKFAIESYKLGEDLFDGSSLSKLDGFPSVEAMFSWFDKRYDLSSPKEFWVYRFLWK